MKLFPPRGQRKTATAWLAMALASLLYLHAVANGAAASRALELVLEAVIWIVGLVFGANASVHAAKRLGSGRDGDDDSPAEGSGKAPRE